MFKNISIRKKLLVGFGLILILIFTVVIYAFLSIAKLNNITRDQSKIVDATEDAYKLNLAVLSFIVNLKDYTEFPDPAVLENIKRDRESTYDLSDKLKKNTDLPEVIEALNRFDALMPHRVDAADKIINSIQIGVNSKDLEKLIEHRDSLDTEARKELQRIIELKNQALEAAINETFQTREKIVRNVILAVLLMISLMVFVSFYTSKAIASPLLNLTNAIKRVSKGDLEVKVAVDSKDEVGSLSIAFDEMTKELSESQNNLKKLNTSLNDQKSLLQDLLQQLPIGVYLAEAPSGKPVMVNDAEIKLLGKGIDPKASKDSYTQTYNLTKEDGSPYPITELPLVITLKTGKATTRDDLVIVRPDKSRMFVKATCSPIYNTKGKMIFAVALTEDITVEKEVDRAKDEFISLTSHQLRTPLTSIRLFSEMLAGEQVGKLETKQKEYVEMIEGSTIRMIALVNDILNVSRIEMNRLRVVPEPTDLTKLVTDYVKEIEPQAKEKHIKIKLDLESNLPKINLDKTLIGQVLHNFLTNALRYSNEKDGKVVVSLKKVKVDYVLSVKDNGIGIPKASQGKIFNRFFRADNAIRKEGEGTGLGLYLAKMIMDSSGGSIGFESSEKTGTTFYAKIPATGMVSKKGDRGLLTKES